MVGRDDVVTRAEFEAVKDEIDRLRDWKHDRAAQMMQKHENEIGVLRKQMDGVNAGGWRYTLEHGKSALIALLLSACAYLIKNHGL